MKDPKKCRKVGPILMGALALLAFGAVPGMEGQQEPAQDSTPPITDVQLESFVTAWVAINEIRNELHNRFARDHAVRARQEARDDADRAIEGILESNGLTAEEFAELNRLVGTDTELRARFDALVEGLRNG